MEKASPVVYSCSGCSSLAQIANDIAITLDSRGVAEMSCVSGIVGKIKPLVNLAADRPIIAIDGCEQSCTKACLESCDMTPSLHFDISSFGIAKKGIHESTLKESNEALKKVYESIAEVFLIPEKKYL